MRYIGKYIFLHNMHMLVFSQFKKYKEIAPRELSLKYLFFKKIYYLWKSCCIFYTQKFFGYHIFQNITLKFTGLSQHLGNPRGLFLPGDHSRAHPVPKKLSFSTAPTYNKGSLKGALQTSLCY